jgi:hypothetical protein
MSSGNPVADCAKKLFRLELEKENKVVNKVVNKDPGDQSKLIRLQANLQFAKLITTHVSSAFKIFMYRSIFL